MRGRPTRCPPHAGRARAPFVLLVTAILLAGCASASKSKPPGSIPTTPALGVPALKLAVLDAVGGHLEYCDPDVFPVARGTPLDNAKRRLPQIKLDRAAYAAILADEHITDDSNLSSDQLIAINDDYKQMQAIQLQPSGGGYSFSVVIPASPPDAGLPTRLAGTVDPSGHVTITARTAGRRPNCPICLALGTRIGTPDGPVPVQRVTVGMRVWTIDRRGRPIVGVVLQTGRTLAPLGHEVVRLTLADGRTVTASAGHPTADGRTVGVLRAGDAFDGSRVVSALLVPYEGGATYDLLPSGPTGDYFADGVLLGSTLASR